MKALYELKEKFEMELEELARKGELEIGRASCRERV